jgi:hypothetical protein
MESTKQAQRARGFNNIPKSNVNDYIFTIRNLKSAIGIVYDKYALRHRRPYIFSILFKQTFRPLFCSVINLENHTSIDRFHHKMITLDVLILQPFFSTHSKLNG